MAVQAIEPDRGVVLSKAVIAAAEQLGLKQVDLAAVLGVDRTRVSRIKSKHNLNETSKEAEIALLVIRLARALFALNGGDKNLMQHFMSTPNKITKGVPKEQIKRIEGLTTVLRFVDAIRGKN